VVAPHSLDGFLKGHSLVFLDTSAFIYFVEHHPRYSPFCETLFGRIEAGKTRAATSTLSLLEVLVQPYRQKNEELVVKFYALLTSYPHLTWVPMTLNVTDHAAKLRAEHRLKTPDSIQAASAIACRASGFICNDKIFEKVKEFESLIIDDCV
jgi:predicted nucleic acid-binding protein